MLYHSLSIVIPVYNEGENISAALGEIKHKVRTPHEIILVYDFDEDNTLPVVKHHIEQGEAIRLVKNRFGKGVLNAIRTGFTAARRDVVLVMMGDLSDELEQVDVMFARINEGYDIVCGSRYMKGGKQIGGPWFKKLLSRTAGESLYYLIGIPTRDITNNFKMYRKKVLDDTVIESRGGFELGMEIVIKAYLRGYRIAEVPSIWRDRQAGESRFQLRRWLPKYLYWYWYGLKGKILFGHALAPQGVPERTARKHATQPSTYSRAYQPTHRG